jgi:hypothetical protein
MNAIFIKLRDKEVLQQQEERRRQNAMTATDTKLRGSTVSSLTDTLTVHISHRII